MKESKYQNKRFKYGTKIAWTLIFIFYSFSEFWLLKAQKDPYQKIFNKPGSAKRYNITIFLQLKEVTSQKENCRDEIAAILSEKLTQILSSNVWPEYLSTGSDM